MEKFIKCKCSQCGTSFTRRKAEVNRSKKLGRKSFCGRSCAATWININSDLLRENSKKGLIGNTNGSGKRDNLSPFRWHMKNIRGREKDKGIKVNITLEYLKKQWDKQKGVCPYTGWELINPGSTTEATKTPLTPNRASIDRIDPSKGYVRGNIQFVAVIVNLAKNGWSRSEVINFCEAVHEYNKVA